MAAIRASLGVALGRRVAAALGPRQFVRLHQHVGWRSTQMQRRGFPLQPHAIASRPIVPLDGQEPELSVAELQSFEERTNLAPENIQQLVSIFRTLAGQKRYLDYAGFEMGLPLVQTMQEGMLCSETYLSAFQAFDLDHSGTIEMDEFILGVGKLINGETNNNSRESTQHCPSWKRISRIVRVDRDLRLIWSQRPRTVLVVKKWNEEAASNAMEKTSQFLGERGLFVLFDPNDPDLPKLNPSYSRAYQKTDQVDLIVAMGGDGTVLRTIQWMGDPDTGLLMPPVMAFALGSLGFLTPHPFENVGCMLDRVLESSMESPLYCTLRSRLRCEVISPEGEVMAVRRALNECLVARGSGSAFQKLDCLVDGKEVAQFQADGVIIATPSGSSAYSMAVGGSLVAPSVPCMLLTPIAPHMLTARPTILPAGCELELRVPQDARSLPVVSFDGMHEYELARGARVRVTTSMSPVPFIHVTQHLDDWFHSISTKLHWANKIRK